MVIRHKKMDRKSVAITIGPGGVEVRLPYWLSTRHPSLAAMVRRRLTQVARDAPPFPDRPLAREQLQLEARRWAAVLGVRPNRIQVRQMVSRWGSCSSRGNVTFSELILEMPLPLREYLICHELAHLRVLNHGPAFRRLMDSAIPDWKQRERWLAGWVASRELAALAASYRR